MPLWSGEKRTRSSRSQDLAGRVKALPNALAFALALALSVSVPASSAVANSDPIYRNHSYSPAERAADLVARMTVAERAAEMASGSSPAIPRLGVQSNGWWNESAHGLYGLELSNSTDLTDLYDTMVYPVDLALGSTWDPDLMYDQASAISDEAREIVPDNSYDLDFFAPTVNLSRDPRWGRNDETFSEDPFLTAAMASQYVNGLQGDDVDGRPLPQGGGYMKAIATVKHFTANNSEVNRLTGSSDIDERTLREYYTAPDRMIIQQSNPGAIMAAYNEVNGIPAAANPHLLNTLARRSFGFKGYVTSDCDGVEGIVIYHGYRPPGLGRPVNETEAHALANAAGDDLNCNVFLDDPLTDQNLLPAAVNEGIRTPTDTYNVNDLDTSAVRLFTARMELGQFGPVNSEPWVKAARSQLPPGKWTNSNANGAITETPARLALARQVADHALVLLKNNVTTRKDGTVGKVLPIQVPKTGPFRVAVIGYLANPINMYLGGYSSFQGAPGAAKEVNAYQGIKQAIQAINPAASVDFYNGFTGGTDAASLTNIDQSAVHAAAGYNDAIVFVGTDGSTAHEGVDRTSTALPGAQAQLVSDVAAQNPSTVAVMETIGEVDTGSFQNAVPAMVWSAYNGEREGNALADVLLGAYDPSGHLPFTWYQSSSQLAPITDYGIQPGPGSPGRTYMYFRGPVSFPFGYGLSYTTFRDSNLRVTPGKLGANGTLNVSVDVTNTGSSYGSNLVQLYVASPGAGVGGQPIKRLEGFRQVILAPGQTQAVTLMVKVPDLAFWNSSHNRFAVDDGQYFVQVANSAAADDVALQQPVTVTGKLKPVPSSLTAEPTMLGDAARRIQQRVIFPERAVVLPGLTVAMNDQSLHRYLGAGHGSSLPHGMRIRFRSDHPGVVSLGPGRALRTIRNGVATVTATVSYRGVRKSTKFVVRVLSELSQITVHSHGTAIPMPGFHPDTYSYDVIVPSGASVPRIGATPDPSGRMGISQARGVPGTARIRVTGPDGIALRYAVYFARPARSDQFTGGHVGSQWTWIRHDPAFATVKSGALVITAEHGQDSGNLHTARNTLVQPALGNWAIQSKLRFSTTPHVNAQQGGIIAYQDDDNYVKLDWEYSSGVAQLSETTEDSLSGAPVSQVLMTLPTKGRLGNTVWLRMVKKGPRYITFYSADGAHFVPLYSVGASLTNVKVGLFAWGGDDTSNSLKVAFSSFKVRNSGITIGQGSGGGHHHRGSKSHKKPHSRSRAAAARVRAGSLESRRAPAPTIDQLVP